MRYYDRSPFMGLHTFYTVVPLPMLSSLFLFLGPLFSNGLFHFNSLDCVFFINNIYIEAGNTRSSVSEPDLDPLSLYETDVVLFHLGAFLYNPSRGFYLSSLG